MAEEEGIQKITKKVNGMISLFEQKIAENDYKPESHLKRSKTFSKPLTKTFTKSEKTIAIPKEPQSINKNDLENIENELKVLENKLSKHKSFTKDDHTQFQTELLFFLSEIVNIESNHEDNILKSKKILIHIIKNCIEILTKKAPGNLYVTRSEQRPTIKPVVNNNINLESEQFVPKPIVVKENKNYVTEIQSSVKNLKKLFEKAGLEENKQRGLEIASQRTRQKSVRVTSKTYDDDDTNIIELYSVDDQVTEKGVLHNTGLRRHNSMLSIENKEIATVDINIGENAKVEVSNVKDLIKNLEINAKNGKTIVKEEIVTKKSVPIKETSNVFENKLFERPPEDIKEQRDDDDSKNEEKIKSKNEPIVKEEIVTRSTPIKETFNVFELAILEQPPEDIREHQKDEHESENQEKTELRNVKDMIKNLEINAKNEKSIVKEDIAMKNYVPTFKVYDNKDILIEPSVLEQPPEDIKKQKDEHDSEHDSEKEEEVASENEEEIVTKKSAQETLHVSENREILVEPTVFEQLPDDIKEQKNDHHSEKEEEVESENEEEIVTKKSAQENLNVSENRESFVEPAVLEQSPDDIKEQEDDEHDSEKGEEAELEHEIEHSADGWREELAISRPKVSELTKVIRDQLSKRNVPEITISAEDDDLSTSDISDLNDSIPEIDEIPENTTNAENHMHSEDSVSESDDDENYKKVTKTENENKPESTLSSMGILGILKSYIAGNKQRNANQVTVTEISDSEDVPEEENLNSNVSSKIEEPLISFNDDNKPGDNEDNQKSIDNGLTSKVNGENSSESSHYESGDEGNNESVEINHNEDEIKLQETNRSESDSSNFQECSETVVKENLDLFNTELFDSNIYRQLVQSTELDDISNVDLRFDSIVAKNGIILDEDDNISVNQVGNVKNIKTNDKTDTDFKQAIRKQLLETDFLEERQQEDTAT